MTNSGTGSSSALSETTSKWYLRSLADHDTHRGWLSSDGSVLALCGAQFTPKPTVRQVGQRLVDGFPDLGSPPVLEQVCSKCRREGNGPLLHPQVAAGGNNGCAMTFRAITTRSSVQERTSNGWRHCHAVCTGLPKL